MPRILLLAAAAIAAAVDCGGQALDWAAVDSDAEAAITGCAEIVS